MHDDRLIGLRFEDGLDRSVKAASPPIFETAPFLFDTYEDYADAAAREKEHFVYSRGTNPTVRAAETVIAALERGEACKCFASGMAAVAAALLGSLSAGDHLILVGRVYETSVSLVRYLSKFGITNTIVQATDAESVAQAITARTRAILMESPASYTFEVTDLAALTALARSRGIRTIVDNSWATPLYLKPLELGADIVVHSASKYLGGHNDLVAGAVIASQAIIDRMHTEEYALIGGSLAPFEAWLLIRGLRTLNIRMEVHHRNGLEVAKYLSEHREVARVNHPGLPSHPQHELARRLFKGYAGLFSFELKNGTYEDIRRTLNRLKLIRIGVSWGAMESQIISPNYGSNLEQLRSEHMPESLVRIAVGHEPPELLIADLEAALGEA
ncbi:L-alanine/L-glutamate racemase [Cohnella sp. JJ-181]|nr:L-alanine/L-glutamate racemase [Cohnella sp. JJ-181]